MTELITKGLSDLPKVIDLVNGISPALKYLPTLLDWLQQSKHTHVAKLMNQKKLSEAKKQNFLEIPKFLLSICSFSLIILKIPGQTNAFVVVLVRMKKEEKMI